MVPERYMELYEGKDLPFRENVPEEWKQDPSYLKKRQEYFAAISGLDENFGRLMDYLKEKGLMENTLIVLSADHGDCMGLMDVTARISGMKNPSGYRFISTDREFRPEKVTYYLPVRIICRRFFSFWELVSRIP